MDNFSFKIEINGVEKIITSVAEANKLIKNLTEEIITAKEAGADFSQALNQLNNALQIKSNILAVSSGAVNLSSSLNKSQIASANAAQALLNLNYIIRDSPYFFQNFALGVLAVGNNLNPLIDSFSRLRAEAGEKSVSTISLLKQALVGGAGLSIAFSVVVTAIQAFVFWMNRSKDATDELKNATSELIEVQNKFKDFKFALTPEQAKELRQRIFGQQAGLEKGMFLENITWFGAQAGSVMNLIKWFPFANEKVNELYKTDKAITDELERQLNILEAQARIWEQMKSFGAEETSRKEPKKDKTLDLQRNLNKELELLLVEGRQREIKQLEQKYEEWKEIAKNNNELLIKVQEAFRKELLRINIEWDRKETDEFLKFLEKRNKAVEEKRKEELEKRAGRFAGRVRPFSDTETIRSLNESIRITQDEGLEEIEQRMRKVQFLSNAVGDALFNAFQRGKFAVDQFLLSIAEAIAKMLIMRTITSMFESIFNLPIGSTQGSLAFKPSPAGGLGKINVNVGGNIKMSGRDFVIQFKHLENQVRNSII